MDRVVVSAPGKLVLFGEYAVLFGAPAVVAAIDRRAVVTLQRERSDRWVVSAPGLAEQPARFQVAAGGTVRWDDEQFGSGTFGLVEKLFGAIDRRNPGVLETSPTGVLSLDTSAFFDGQGGAPSKLGLGSSAALTVALASALEIWSGSAWSENAEQRLDQLVTIHREIQGGAGSGLDVAASLLGGVLRFQLADDGSVTVAAPVSLPERLRMVFVWTGRAASTGDFLARLRECREARKVEIDAVLDLLSTISSAGVDAMVAGDYHAFLGHVDSFWNALEKLGAMIEMPVLSEEHQRLRGLAEGCGVHYKPSGAGGGDFGIGFASDRAAALDFAGGAASEGFRAIDLRVDSIGVDPSM